MSRILLLSSPPMDFQSRRAMQSIERALGNSYTVVARSLGETSASPTRSISIVRELLREPYDLVIVWGTPALLTAAVAHSGPTVFSFTRFPTLAQIKWLRSAMDYRDVHLICPTSTMHRFCIERGVPIERCHLIRPGVEFGRVNRRRDAKLRLAMGLADQDHALLLAGESTREADHLAAIWAGSILQHLDPKCRLLVWGRGDRVGRLLRFAEQLKQSQMLVVAEQRLGRNIEFEELLPAADSVLITAKGSVSTLPIAICMAAGLPIVSTVTSEVAELLEDRHTAFMVPRSSPRTIAQRIMDLQADKNAQWSLADMAKTEAFEYFAHSRFVNQYRTVVSQVLAGEKVSVPQAAPGAGLRFHGLG